MDAPIPLSREQIKAVQDWAADDHLWSTKETTKFNLYTFARLILKLAGNPPSPEVSSPTAASPALKDQSHELAALPRPQPPETLEAESMYSPTSGYPAPLPDRAETEPRLAQDDTLTSPLSLDAITQARKEVLDWFGVDCLSADDERIVDHLIQVVQAHAAQPIEQEKNETKDKDHARLAPASAPRHESDLRVGDRDELDECSVSPGQFTVSHFCSRGTRGCYLTHRWESRKPENRMPTVGEWQDIASAPTDGTLVLLFCSGVMMTGSYRHGFWWDHYDEYTCQPTSWMPLPPAPKET